MKSKKILREMFLGESEGVDWQAQYQQYAADMKQHGFNVLPFDEWKETVESFLDGIEQHFSAPGEDPRATIKRLGKSMDPNGVKS